MLRIAFRFFKVLGLVLISIIGLSNCQPILDIFDFTPTATYTVRYEDNGATAGTTPLDPNLYSHGQTATILGNSGNLVRTGYSFAGWNTKTDGSGTTYTQGQSFTLGKSDVILHAKWNGYMLYYNFLSALKDQGYAFMNFETYWASDKATLPSKLIVIRHDIHAFDLGTTQAVEEIERVVIGGGSATYYVMLDMPPESLQPDYPSLRLRYLDMIGWLKTRGEDIQPHISPIDIYAYGVQPTPLWLAEPAEELKPQFDQNYEYTSGQYGSNISVKKSGVDVFDLAGINRDTLPLLRAYNDAWEQVTGLHVNSYSAHGSGTPMNQVLNNARLLDQDVWITAGIYQFDAYNTRIFHVLKYLSDVETDPQWMGHPETLSPGRYELLAHPSYWHW